MTIKRQIIQTKLKEAKELFKGFAKNDISKSESGDSGFKMQMLNRALNVDATISIDVINAMKKKGYETNIRDMSVQELHWFLVYTKIRKEEVKRPDLSLYNQ